MSEQESRPRIGVTLVVDRQLLVADVVGFAKKDCTRCHGKGFVVKVFHASAKGETKQADACPCAIRRLNKKHKNDVVILDGVPHWKAGKAPALTA